MTENDDYLTSEQERKLTRVIRELIAAYADLSAIEATAMQVLDDYRKYALAEPATAAAIAAEDLEAEQ
jgi:hypothetical protein